MKTKQQTAPIDQRPTCSVCGGRNVETNAWIEYRDDGTAEVVNTEGPIGDDNGNWCHDCDDHTPLDFPTTTPADDARRQAAAAARANGPELLAVLNRLRHCPDLNLDDLDDQTVAALEAADEMLSRCAPAIR